MSSPARSGSTPPPPVGRALLKAAAAINFAFALAHVAMIAIGPPAYVYFGAVRLAEMARQGSLFPPAVTLALSCVFLVFGLYALAGAGVVQRLPFVHAGLIAIGVVYALRGLIVVLDVMQLFRGAKYPGRQIFFSTVSLGLGVLYLAGASLRRRER